MESLHGVVDENVRIMDIKREKENLQTTLSLCVASRKSPLTTGCSARHTINFPSSSTVGEKLSSDFVVLFKISSLSKWCRSKKKNERVRKKRERWKQEKLTFLLLLKFYFILFARWFLSSCCCYYLELEKERNGKLYSRFKLIIAIILFILKNLPSFF